MRKAIGAAVGGSSGSCATTASGPSPDDATGPARRPCTTDSRHYLAVAPNLLAQRFEASAPNRVWLADITCIPTAEGWLYLAAVLDVATRKIVGWAMRDHMRTELALSALMMAVQRQRPSRGLIHHSDRGSQFAAEAYAKQIAAVGAVPSMSRTGNCYDNAPMESFFHTLKVELVYQCRWATRDEARVVPQFEFSSPRLR
jgi:putative transposase